MILLMLVSVMKKLEILQRFNVCNKICGIVRAFSTTILKI